MLGCVLSSRITLSALKPFTLNQTVSRNFTFLYLSTSLLVPSHAVPIVCDRVLGRRNVYKVDCIVRQTDEATPLVLQLRL